PSRSPPAPRHLARRRRLWLEELEVRLAPATLDLNAGTGILTFTLDPDAAAAMSGSGNTLTFDAGPGHTITLSGAAAANGFTGGAQTSTGSLSNIGDISIAGAAGTGVFNINSLGNPLPSLEINDVGFTGVNAGFVTTNAGFGQVYGGRVVLTTSTTLTATVGEVFFDTTVDSGSGTEPLTIAGNARFGDNVSGGGVGRTAAL